MKLLQNETITKIKSHNGKIHQTKHSNATIARNRTNRKLQDNIMLPEIKKIPTTPIFSTLKPTKKKLKVFIIHFKIVKKAEIQQPSN